MPVDLTKLTDEQLEAYKSLRAGKQEPKPLQVEAPKVQSEGPGPVTRFFKGATGVDFSKPAPKPNFGDTLKQGLRQATYGNVLDLVRNQYKPFKKAYEEFQTGDWGPAIGHTAAGLLPVVGPQAARAGELFSEGDTAGGLGASLTALLPFGRRAPGAVKNAAITAASKVNPEIAGAAGGGLGYMAGHKLGGWEMGLPAGYMGRAIGKSLVEKARAAKAAIGQVNPPEAPQAKGPSLGMLKSAVKSGSMPMEQFETHLDKLGFDEETKGIILNNLQAETAPKAKITPGETPKTLALGHLKNAAKEGLITPEEFTSKLERMGYDEEARGTLTELLKRDVASKAAKDSESAVEGLETPIKKVEFPGKRVSKPVEFPQSSPEDYRPSGQWMNPFEEKGPPYKPSITESQIESSQSTARVAKEIKLGNYLNDNFDDLSTIPKTAEFLKTIGKEAGLKWKPSFRTLEKAIKKAKMLRFEPM